MRTPVLEIIDQCENRYLSQEEEDEILGYVRDLPDLLRVARKIKENEPEICRRAVHRVRERYPEVSEAHNEQWASLFRQFQRALRTCVQAMIVGDPEFADEKLLIWLRSILLTLDLAPGFVRDSFGALGAEAVRDLEMEEKEYLQPIMTRTAQVLSSQEESGSTPGL